MTNIFFAILYIFGVLSTLISPSTILFFAYFGLFFPVILFANIVFVIFWILKKRKYWLISTFLIAITFSHAKTAFNVPFATFWHNSCDKEIKILSYNISALGYLKDFNKFGNYLKETDADIVCLQEFGYWNKDKDRLKNVIKKLYPYSHIWYKNQRKRYSWGVATFSKYPILNKKKINYKSSYNISVYSDILIGSDTVRVINNHLESNKFTRHDYQKPNKSLDRQYLYNASSRLSRKLGSAYRIRAKQANIIRDLIDSTKHKVIVCGDFNDVIESYSYHKIKGDMQDLFTSTAWGYRFSFHKNGMFVGIDHILIDKKLVPISLNIAHQQFSDHYPIVGVIGLVE